MQNDFRDKIASAIANGSRDLNDVVDNVMSVIALQAAAMPVLVERDIPYGAIENGRAFLNRVEQQVGLVCNLHELRMCFEALVQHIMTPPAPGGADDGR